LGVARREFVAGVRVLLLESAAVMDFENAKSKFSNARMVCQDASRFPAWPFSAHGDGGCSC
jgi:hypothetical protein